MTLRRTVRRCICVQIQIYNTTTIQQRAELSCGNVWYKTNRAHTAISTRKTKTCTLHMYKHAVLIITVYLFPRKSRMFWRQFSCKSLNRSWFLKEKKQTLLYDQRNYFVYAILLQMPFGKCDDKSWRPTKLFFHILGSNDNQEL
jgi:hypothetical protein